MKIEINGNKIIVEGCEVFGEIKKPEFKEGDIAELKTIGLGSVVVEIVMHNNELCIHDPENGYYPLKRVSKENGMSLTKLNK